MAVSLSRKPNVDFERQVKHLAWFALLASIALLTPITREGLAPRLQVVVGLGAAILLVAIWMVVVSVPRYVRQQQSRAYDLAKASHQEGACQTVEAIQDRVANLLSITAGYAEFLVDDDQLPSEARERAQHALDGALASARVVSTFKEALGCQGRRYVEPAATEPLPRVSVSAQTSPHAQRRTQRTQWTYDAARGRIAGPGGVTIATLPSDADEAAATARGRLIADAPTLLETVEAAQQLGAKILAEGTLTRDMALELRHLLDGINDVAARIDLAASS